MTRISVIAAAAAVLFSALLSGGTAQAQYPPPNGNVFCEGSVTVQKTGGLVQIFAKVTDGSGNIIVGQLVNFQITSQPDSDAFLSASSAFTNVFGIASVVLVTGQVEGEIVVTCSAPPPPPTIVVIPPQGQVITQVQQIQVITPPNTGDGGLLGTGPSTRPSATTVAAYGGLAGTLLVTSIALVMGRRKVTSIS